MVDFKFKKMDWQDELLVTKEERALSAQVQVYWSNFARYGDPNGGGGGGDGTIEWPMAYSSGAGNGHEEAEALGLGLPLRVLKGEKRAECAFWKVEGVIQPPGFGVGTLV